jgi:glucose/arabinose dehydrogenase
VSIRRRALVVASALVAIATLSIAAPVGAVPVAPSGGGIGLTRIVGGLTDPVFVTHAGDDRLFIVEQVGRIKIARRVSGSWRVTGTFLDIRSIVLDGGERGLLGLAFHPGYASNGRFYVHYTNNSGDHVIAEYRRGSSAGRANPSSRRLVLRVNDPYENHNGGWLAFKGSYLYIAFGDGGSGGDPGNRGQRLDTLLGKILRINPLDPDGRGPKRYSIPRDNPRVGRTGKDEIWAWGLRNPWRNSFDRLTGHLWIGDVGQGSYEEIDHAGTGKGKNFGWRLLEGRHRYPSGNLCRSNCKTLPIAEYGHGGGNCSVTGGYVARRSGAARYGQYFFGDYCSGRLWSIPASFSGGSLPSPTRTGLAISSFGEGNDGRIYIVNRNGSIFRVNGT